MGCNQSKIENEEAVSRCKERKLFMRHAVASRNAFAAAQTSYTVSLRNTGAALSDFASGESLFPHLLPHLTHSTSAPSYNTPIPPEPSSFGTHLPPPPPPPADVAAQPPAPLQRAQSMPQLQSSKAAPHRSETIVEEVDEEEEEEVENEADSLKRRPSGRRGAGVRAMEEIPPPPTPPPVMATLNRAPPSPLPGAETWDYFFNQEDMQPGGSLGGPEEVNMETEEFERKLLEERSKRADNSSASSRARKVEDLPPKVPDKVADKPPLPPQEVATGSGGGKGARRGKQQVVVSPTPGAGGGGGEVKRPGKTASLVKICSELDDRFLKASESASEVSKLLEAARLHYHTSFANNCGHINHSDRVMKVVTWNRSFRGPLNSDTGKDDFESEENETHATVLDKLLAWEKKLYDEVKAGEIMKFDYQRKVALLNKQKKRGASPETLEKTKAAVSRLHTRYIIDMQSLDSTVSEIERLRDEQLYPKLVALVDGMATMWGSMRIYHSEQADIAEAWKYVDISQCVKETSVLHFEQTEQLWSIVRGWHEQFDKMISNQKGYIKDLNSWLKLNIVPIESNMKEKVSSPPRPPNPPIQHLLLAWHDSMETLPEELAKGAIFGFAAVLDSIIQEEDVELKMRTRCEEARKDLFRKTHAFEDWYNKYTQRRPSPDEAGPDTPEDFAHDQALIEREVGIEMAKKRVEEEEAAYQKHCIKVREKCLTNLKARLPELFRSLSEFAVACSEVYRKLQDISQQERNQRSS